MSHFFKSLVQSYVYLLCLGLSLNDIEEQERNAINVDPFAGGGYLRTR